MFARSTLAPLIIPVLAFAVACGGGGDSSTPTPTSTVTAAETARPDLGPAGAVVIFGSPDATEQALNAVADAGGPSRFYLAGESRDQGSFDDAGLPGDAVVRGVSLAFSGVERAEPIFDTEPFSGVREGYDAVYLIALAAAAANSTDPAAIREHLPYVANSPGPLVLTGPASFAEALDELAGGNDINYQGISSQNDFTADGESAKGRVNVWRLLGEQIIEQEVRDVDLAAEVDADVPQGGLSPADEAPSGPLRIGAVLPLGSDEGTAVQEAMNTAADEINEAGGLFGSDIEVIFAGEADGAAAAVEDLEGQGVSAIVGPLGTDAAIAVAGAVDVFQVALTGSAALPLAEGGLVVRGIGGDVLQTSPLANLALEDEVEVVCVIFEAGAANSALANAFRDAFEHKGGGVRQLVEIAAGDGSGMDVSSCLGA